MIVRWLRRASRDCSHQIHTQRAITDHLLGERSEVGELLVAA
jgi:hypothetical protein